MLTAMVTVLLKKTLASLIKQLYDYRGKTGKYFLFIILALTLSCYFLSILTEKSAKKWATAGEIFCDVLHNLRLRFKL